MIAESKSSNVLQDLFISNSRWANNILASQPDFFEESAKGQSPNILWIGCSDSRVPESVITSARPGDIFVHRNIANQLFTDDTNFQSVLQYAVDSLHVEHVVVVGHSKCGGVQSCLKAARSQEIPSDKAVSTVHTLPAAAPLNRWLEPLTRLAASLGVSSIPYDDALDLLVDENVKLQINNLSKMQTITDNWAQSKDIVAAGEEYRAVTIHGWVYELETGHLRDLNVSQGPPSRHD